MREIIRTEGIVLRRRDFGETSRIAVVYTYRKGKVQLLAKGARRPRSKFGAALEPLTLGEYVFYYREAKDLYTLSEAAISTSYQRLREDPPRLVYGLACAEAADKLTRELDPDPRSVRVLAAALDALGVGTSPRLVLGHYLLHLAAGMGFKPELITCKNCRTVRPGGSVTFIPADGAILCDRCASGSGGGIVMGPNAYNLLLFLSEIPASKLARVKASPGAATRAISFLLAHLRYHTDMELKALKSLSALMGTG
jgi:DNA repair protein RecO (recombination protein O)